MGMKANSGFFKGTSGQLKYKLNMQYFGSKIFNSKGKVTLTSLEQYGSDLLNKNDVEVQNLMSEAGYKSKIIKSNHGVKEHMKVVSLNPSKDRNITQIQVSLSGSGHHGNVPYVKVSTKDIGVIKIVNGKKSEYKEGTKEKAKIFFKGGKN